MHDELRCVALRSESIAEAWVSALVGAGCLRRVQSELARQHSPPLFSARMYSPFSAHAPQLASGASTPRASDTGAAFGAMRGREPRWSDSSDSEASGPISAKVRLRRRSSSLPVRSARCQSPRQKSR
jgi:hypothetical protein